MSRASLLLGIIICVVAFNPHEVEAQLRRSYWGISGAFTPTWSVPDYQEVLFDADQVDLRGSELRIGFVRGNIIGDDWGVSFVRRDIADRDVAVAKSDGTVMATRRNTLIGVELHAFNAFATIKSRVQIGLSFGGGVGVYRNSILRTPPVGQSEIVDAKFLFSPGDTVWEVTPLGRLELTGAVILTPHLKVRVGGGLNFPGQQLISFTGVYLF